MEPLYNNVFYIIHCDSKISETMARKERARIEFCKACSYTSVFQPSICEQFNKRHKTILQRLLLASIQLISYFREEQAWYGKCDITSMFAHDYFFTEYFFHRVVFHNCGFF